MRRELCRRVIIAAEEKALCPTAASAYIGGRGGVSVWIF
jgi:hypothetical protein